MHYICSRINIVLESVSIKVTNYHHIYDVVMMSYML